MEPAQTAPAVPQVSLPLLEPTPEPESEPETYRTYYKFVDASGSLHFVETLAQVPAGKRPQATRIELRSRVDETETARRSPKPAAEPQRAAPAPEPERVLAAMHRLEEPPANLSALGEASVTVYTTAWCGWCRKTLAHLDQRGIPYVNRDIELEQGAARELRSKTGSTAIPVVEVDGELVRGYDRKRLDELIDRL
jgi:glutaredoxin